MGCDGSVLGRGQAGNGPSLLWNHGILRVGKTPGITEPVQVGKDLSDHGTMEWFKAGKALLGHGIQPLTQHCRGGHRATPPRATSVGFWDISRDGHSTNSLGRIPCESHTSPRLCCSRDWLCLDALPQRFPVFPVCQGPRPPALGVLEGTLDGLLGFLLLGYPRPHSQAQGRRDVKQE